MIIYHQNNVAGFAGNHVMYWPTQPLVQQHVRIALRVVLVAGEVLAKVEAFASVLMSLSTGESVAAELSTVPSVELGVDG